MLLLSWEFNFDEDISVDTMWSAPKPTEIIARINPQPGLGVIFPGFIAHRVHPDITGTLVFSRISH